MSLELLALICFSLGVGVWMLVEHPTINLVAKFVGAVGGILYGLILLFNHFN